MATSNGSIIGSWYAVNPGGGTDQISFNFLADGTFLVADQGTTARDPTGTSGLEWGTYTWDAATGALSLSVQINTDGEWGLSHSGINTATVIDNVLSFTGTDGTTTVSRLISPDAASIVGSWYTAPVGQGGTDQIVFTFLADGRYLIADKGTVAHDPTGTSGIEWGTYSWNSATGAFNFTNVGNTDGEWGFSAHQGTAGQGVLQVSGDTLSITFSDGTGSAIRLSPLAAGPATITGTPNADSLTGTAAAETINALDGNDSITGGGGNDTIDGGAGIDTANYSGARAGYSVAASGNGFAVAGGSEGSDTLAAVERLHFSDSNLALDLSGNAGMVAKILGAVFGASAVSNAQYVGIGLSYADSGMSYAALMQFAIDHSAIGATHTHAQVVTLLWANVIGGTPPPADLLTYTNMLDTGTSEGALGVLAADTSFNTAHINLTGLAQSGLVYT